MGATLSAIPAGILVLNQQGMVLFANMRACEILARELAAVVGVSVDDLLAPLSVLRDPAQYGRGEVEIQVNHRARVVGYSLSAMESPPAPESNCEVCLFQDITPMHQVRVDRDRLLQLAAVGSALPSILHELRNPLAAVTAKLEVMLEEVTDEVTVEDLHSVLGEVRRATVLLQGVGAVGRQLRSDNYQAIDFGLWEAVRLLESTAARSRTTIHAEIPSLPVMPLDASVMRTILFNLLSNAIAACDVGGSIGVHAQLAEDGQFMLSVEDDGHGMDAETLARCTDLFFTTKRHGSGIGLALCRQAVEDANGTLVVESAPGEGSRITVSVSTRSASRGRRPSA